MQTRTKKTLATTALGLAFVAAAAGSASADALSGLPLGSATNLVPGATDTASGAHSAISHGTSALPADAGKLLPSGNHLDGNQVGSVTSLLGGLPLGG